jgi:UDP-glucose 4-epimerase
VIVHVTGWEGFVGRFLVQELRDRSHDVNGSGSAAALSPGEVLAGNPETVVHIGACVGRERCDREKDLAVTMNATSTLLLAEACARTQTKLLLVSSAEVYGEKTHRNLHETEPPGKPWNLYALTKQWAEHACRLILPPESLTIARLGMQYGPGRRPGTDTLTNFLWAAMHDEDLRFYRDARRTWTFVGDTARALAQLVEVGPRWLEQGKHSAEPAVFNVESDEEYEMGAVAEMVRALAGGRSRLVEIPRPSGYSDLSSLDTRRLRALGWLPQVSLEEGIRLVYDALREYRLQAEAP